MITQILANALVTGSIYLLVAVAFLVAFRLRSFFDFSFGAIILVAPYSAIAISALGLPLWLGNVLGCFVSVSLCLGIHVLVFEPLDRYGGSSLEKLLASLGILIVIQNVISVVFGDFARNVGAAASEAFRVGGAHVTSVQIYLIGISAVVVAGLDIATNRTTFGLAVRAIGTDPELAYGYGVPVARVTVFAIGFSGFLAGSAGVAMALDVAVTPTGGLKPLLGGIVAVVVAGGHTIRGVALVAVGLALAEHLSVLIIGSTWKDAVVFIVLLVVLLSRPTGVQALTERAG